jgi:hypothetical protein
MRKKNAAYEHAFLLKIILLCLVLPVSLFAQERAEYPNEEPKAKPFE